MDDRTSRVNKPTTTATAEASSRENVHPAVQIPAGIESYSPIDPSYAEHIIPVNKRFKVFPNMVIYPKSAEEVAGIVKAVHGATPSTTKTGASSSECPIRIVVRSGGHNYAAFSSGVEGTSEVTGKEADPVIVIDLKHFDTIEYDEQTKIATAGSGTRLGKVSTELIKRGRALPRSLADGVCPNVGLGGHVLHGGHGFTSRAWGLAMDRIVEMQVVLADGSIVNASDHESRHKDLFWAMRGAGPSFGIALSFKLLTLPVPPTNVHFVYEWDAVPISDAAKILLEYQKWLPDVPSELGTGLMFCSDKNKGCVHVWFSGQYLGPLVKFQTLVNPFFAQIEQYLDFSPLKSNQQPNPRHAGQNPTFKYNECTFERALEYLGDGTGDSDTFYATSLSVPEGGELTETQVKALLSYLVEDTTGAAQEVHWFAMADNWQGMREVLIRSRTGEDADKWAYAGTANYVDVEMSREEAQRMYYGDKVPRLREIKKRYDPKNLFRYKHSILPAE
ncbi:hypothetical protein FRC17_005208 [Serendipita sp. 399]|nr:hypothetical protein FRC17_005208 [Serendipita sp. 399]